MNSFLLRYIKPYHGPEVHRKPTENYNKNKLKYTKENLKHASRKTQAESRPNFYRKSTGSGTKLIANISFLFVLIVTKKHITAKYKRMTNVIELNVPKMELK